jgi:hypothetical protein
MISILKGLDSGICTVHIIPSPGSTLKSALVIKLLLNQDQISSPPKFCWQNLSKTAIQS